LTIFTDAELAHIQSLRGHLTAAVPHIVSLPPPLTKILTSPAAMAYLVAVVGANWGYHTLSNGIPMYLSDVHNLSIKEVSMTHSLAIVWEFGPKCVAFTRLDKIRLAYL
jgi:hypothetical protein